LPQQFIPTLAEISGEIDAGVGAQQRKPLPATRKPR
jgi:hypothetical protein